jgi:hypothetical protein
MAPCLQGQHRPSAQVRVTSRFVAPDSTAMFTPRRSSFSAASTQLRCLHDDFDATLGAHRVQPCGKKLTTSCMVSGAACSRGTKQGRGVEELGSSRCCRRSPGDRTVPGSVGGAGRRAGAALAGAPGRTPLRLAAPAGGGGRCPAPASVHRPAAGQTETHAGLWEPSSARLGSRGSGVRSGVLRQPGSIGTPHFRTARQFRHSAEVVGACGEGLSDLGQEVGGQDGQGPVDQEAGRRPEPPGLRGRTSLGCRRPGMPSRGSW